MTMGISSPLMAGMSLGLRRRGLISSVCSTVLAFRAIAHASTEHALILLSDNGKNDLASLRFDNFIARSYDKAGAIWYTASIVLTAPGDYRIRHSIVATRTGISETAAFHLFMLDVETKLDAVLRGNGVDSGSLPAKQSQQRKGSSSTVSIISTPSKAMAPPKLKNHDYNTWSGALLSISPKSKISTHFSHSSKASQGTQKSFALSKYSQASKFGSQRRCTPILNRQRSRTSPLCPP